MVERSWKIIMGLGGRGSPSSEISAPLEMVGVGDCFFSGHSAFTEHLRPLDLSCGLPSRVLFLWTPSKAPDFHGAHLMAKWFATVQKYLCSYPHWLLSAQQQKAVCCVNSAKAQPAPFRASTAQARGTRPWAEGPRTCGAESSCFTALAFFFLFKNILLCMYFFRHFTDN